ncbi:hypothetical protein GCM10027030_05880 [Luteococcus sediminum]
MSTPVLPRTSDLVGYQKVDGAHRVVLRAGVSVAVPLAVVILLGHVEWSPYACFGAFASLYGRASEHTTRMQMQLSAAVTMTAAVLTGVLVGSLDHSPWVQVLVAAVIATTGEAFARAHSYHPGGPLFFIFAFGAISSAPHRLADLRTAVLVTGGAALFSVLVGALGILRDPCGVRGGHCAPPSPCGSSSPAAGSRPGWPWRCSCPVPSRCCCRSGTPIGRWSPRWRR